MSSVLDLTGQVRPEYAHLPKLARPGTILVLDEATLKWYEIATAATPVPLRVRETAYEALCRHAVAGGLELEGDLGFVVLHRCGESFYFLLICTWRNDNELWETVWAKKGAEDPSFEPWPSEGRHRPTFCVWELAVVCHEQRAWSRYLRSERDAASRREYLLDSYEGEV
jgi:hypothetical protein